MPPFIGRKRQASTPPAAPQPVAKKQKATSQKSAKGTSVAEKKKFLDTLVDSDESSLSDADSDEFEDVLPATKNAQTQSDDEEIEWEDAIQADEEEVERPLELNAIGEDLELTLGGKDDQTELKSDKKKGPSKKERQTRILTHCMHVQFLMWHNAIRNTWIADKGVQDILLSQLPPQIKEVVEQWRRDCGDNIEKPAKDLTPSKAKSKGKGKSKAGKKAQKQRDWGGEAERQEAGGVNLSRADPTLRMLKYLAKYWNKAFRITAPGLRKHGYKPMKTLKQEMSSFYKDDHDPEIHGERIKDIKEFRECAKKREGSRDVGAQLFTALCRALGVEARMVANLQPLGFGWTKLEEASLKKAKPTVEAKVESSSDKEADESEEVVQSANSITKKTAKATPKSKRGGTKDAPLDLEDSSELSDAPSAGSLVEIASRSKKRLVKRYDRDLPFPIYWTEVVSPISFKVYPVDSMQLLAAPATNDESLTLFEPRGAKADKARQMIAYVVAHSPDGTAKDVTTRYLKRHMWPGKTKGMRMPAEKVAIYNKKGKVQSYQEYDWFKTVMGGYNRPFKSRTQVDDIEEANELKPVKVEKKAVVEGEESLQFYKQSAEFVLERFLRREEALLPGAEPVKTFTSGKGNKTQEDLVYKRSDVVSCKTEESWHKEGRQPMADAIPMKHVPIRAVTTTRRREVEDLTKRNNGVKPMQPLYSVEQTEYIIPPPIQNGVIPKNAYGNIDCFVPSMVPKGAVHVPLRSTARVCKKLGFDFAEAVVGFEFGGRMAIPVIKGVVVAAENRQALVEAWTVEEEARQVKEDEKRLKLVLSTWRKFLMGMRILDRIRAEIGDDPSAFEQDAVNPFLRPDLPQEDEEEEEVEEGGFLRDDQEENLDGKELEIVDHQEEPMATREDNDVIMGGGFMTDDTPDDLTDHVFDNSVAGGISSTLNSDPDEDEEPVPKTKSRNKAPAKTKPTPAKPSSTGRRSGRSTTVKSKYFDATDDEENLQDDDYEEIEEKPANKNTKSSIAKTGTAGGKKNKKIA